MATTHNPEKGRPRTLDCQEWEAMLADALDGTLVARDAEAFTAHSKSCAGCGELLEEAKQGTEWLRFLRETPEAPEGLLEKILAGTTGSAEMQPLVSAGAVALPRQPWMGVSVGMLHRHVAESRILMTLAMAFFSIALTLNLTGVHLNQIHLSDLKPGNLVSNVSHQYFTTTSHVKRYYLNMRVVYDIESRLNEMRQNDGRQTNDQPQAQPATQQQPTQQPAPASKPGGSARKGADQTTPGGASMRDENERGGGVVHPTPARRGGQSAEPMMVDCPLRKGSDNSNTFSLYRAARAHHHAGSAHDVPYPGEDHKPTERSLV